VIRQTGSRVDQPPVGFPAKTSYGIAALMELAGVHASGEVLQVAEIAARQGIPERYLEQMMTSLRRGGLLRSLRGPRGGYRLSRAPEAVSLAEVIHCLEGDPADRASDPARTPEFQVIDALAEELARDRRSRLSSTSLADLIDQRDQRLQAQAMYFI
jgi:Rrf2 family protein